MATIKTVRVKNETISFLFGVRFLTLLQKTLNIETFEEIGARLQKPTFEDIAKILFCAHENACFYLRKELTIEDADRMHYTLDDMGIEKAMEVLSDGMSELMAVTNGTQGAKKKAVPK
jgi:hypothetical protein